MIKSKRIYHEKDLLFQLDGDADVMKYITNMSPVGFFVYKRVQFSLQIKWSSISNRGCSGCKMNRKTLTQIM